MSMRRAEARAKNTIRLGAAEFGWSPSVIATHRHSTMPWHREPVASSWDVAARPLVRCRTAGKRDLLSLVAQYSAHLAWLRFCGVKDPVFAPEDWMVESSRGEDCRLIRIHAPREQNEDEQNPLGLVIAFSSYLGVSDLEVLTRTTAKPDAVYHEIHRKLRDEASPATAWLRRSAYGAVIAPGSDGLHRILREPGLYGYSDDHIFEAITAFAELQGSGQFLVMGSVTASPLEAWSAAASLDPAVARIDGDPGQAAEKILAIAREKPIAIAVRRLDLFDQPSRQLLSILLGHHEEISLLLPPAAAGSSFARQESICLDDTRYFVTSPRLEPFAFVRAALEKIDPHLRGDWVARWVETPAYDEFLDTGIVLIESSDWKVDEPLRSYIAALALIGDTITEDVAMSYLGQLGCQLQLDAICAPSILEAEDGVIRFASPECQRYFARQVPPASQRALYAVAATTLERCGSRRAADFYILAGDQAKARDLLESDAGSTVPWQTVLSTLEAVPESLVMSSPLLSAQLCRALISAGQYSRADALTMGIEQGERELLQARIHRRRGNYRAALSLLGNPDDECVNSLMLERLLLMGELLRLTGDLDGADSCFRRCRESLTHQRSGDERIAFESALVDLDRERQPHVPDGDSHLAMRLRAYQALLSFDYAAAVSYARSAISAAPDVPSAIDASLDLMNAQFLAGEWEDARYSAREALALVEETEGDRASGGALFLLAYLCADGGQWKQAREKIERMRSFYRRTGDDARLREVDLIEAYLALSDGDSSAARRTAAPLLAATVQRDIREAAALIIDEADWMEGRLERLHSTGASGCIELTQWHLVQRCRLSGTLDPDLQSPVWSAIARCELDPDSFASGVGHFAVTVSDRLRAIRSGVGMLHRRENAAVREWVARTCRELACSSVQLPGAVPEASPEIALVHELASREFPFESQRLAGHEWRFAIRNRLGAWNQWGSLPPLAAEALELVSSNPPGDWRPCGDRGLVFVEGIEKWPVASQVAVTNLMRLRADHQMLRNLLAEEDRSSVADAPSPGGIIGESAAIREVTAKINRLARSEAVVCILGESGTGKELVARSIHRQSPRRGRIFTPINCAALPDALVESELFGHVRGAYTGADRDHAGLIESTDGGTLFLDEIGELPLSTQSKLLRFLQEGEYRRVGDNAVRRADVRVIAATNRELEKVVDEGLFREDLFYRINVIEIRVPPLRERGSDIVLLARFFLAEEHARQRSGPEKFTEDVELVLLSHNWPGNVRELQNAVKASFAMAGDARRIGLDHLPARLRGVQIRNASTGSYFEELNRFRKSLVEQSLLSASGNQNQAAKLLGISRQALAYQIRELGILVKDSADRRRRT